MSARTIWEWEQAEYSPAEEHGTATYFPGMPYEVTLLIPNFPQAHELANAIESALLHARYEARIGLLAEIGRIQP